LSEMIDMNALGQEILEINRANGWRVTVPDDWVSEDRGPDDYRVYKVGNSLALIVSEIGEYLEAETPENEREEIADIAIRVMDTLSGLGIECRPVWLDLRRECRSHGFTLNAMMKSLGRAMETYRKQKDYGRLAKAEFGEHLRDCLVACAEIAHIQEWDLLAEIRKKLDKNRTRGFRHGGKLV
jgi:NTP pyrophosphatase (non-canonical NTP hydrolase)